MIGTIKVHSWNGTTSDISIRTTEETWGQLCQRYCESNLLHPPQLLQLLKKLHHPDDDDDDDKNQNQNQRQPLARYRFRYGDGFATLIQVQWSSNKNGHVKEEEEEEKEEEGDDSNSILAEANVTLQVLSNSNENMLLPSYHPISAVLSSATTTTNGDDGERHQPLLEVQLQLEKICIIQEDDEKILEDEEFIGVTQLPFPRSDAKTHILNLREHTVFDGVIDNYWVVKDYASTLAATSFAAAASTASTAKEAKNGTKEEAEEDAKLPVAKKKKRKSTSTSSSSGGAAASEVTPDGSSIESQPAKDFPEGWTTRTFPRKSAKTGSRRMADTYWYSPIKKFRFRSKTEVNLFLTCLKNAAGGGSGGGNNNKDDEDAAMKLFQKKKKMRRSK
eukprot:CAMPEP_0183720452 /NCGR_PEP_ID=MMETSP0737-20130205/13062_1 /TAXON_ID=385413 /ORGANISM="Thalassiosira miniscula, Strain CCMP1093" /LENGTH=389 /DNA_ID=CAMNT_0025950317 /DNA_START=175 /DNA_END=1344 /DNA_ORIENTATION=-